MKTFARLQWQDHSARGIMNDDANKVALDYILEEKQTKCS